MLFLGFLDSRMSPFDKQQPAQDRVQKIDRFNVLISFIDWFYDTISFKNLGMLQFKKILIHIGRAKGWLI